LLGTGTLVAGRYEILTQLGAGGGGQVFAALDRTTDKKVAVKILGKRLAQDRVARSMFELEARVAGRVESEHIVQVSDAGIDPMNQMPFVVMEFLKGMDLNELITSEGPLEASRTLQYLAQAASGLEKAHGWCRDGKPSPIVHRDLKPENLFLTHREDGTPLVKILDWGIAKVLTGSVTLSQDLRGTPLYMAPEQLLPAPVTPATDVWALGLLAYFLLTGQCYWKSAQREHAVLPAIVKEVCEGPVELPSVQMQQLGVVLGDARTFDGWFMRCVNLDPAERYQHAAEAIKALANALGFSPDEYEALNSSNRPTPVRSHPANAMPVRPDERGADLQSSPLPGRAKHRWFPLLWPALGLAAGASVAWVSMRHAGNQPIAAPSSVSSQNPEATAKATQARSQKALHELAPAESASPAPSVSPSSAVADAPPAPPASGRQPSPPARSAPATRRAAAPNTSNQLSGRPGTYREDRLVPDPRHTKR
jgi:serine/threonine protein kinase